MRVDLNGAIVMKKEIHAGLPSLLSTDSLSLFTDSLSLLPTRSLYVFLSPNVISFAPSLASYDLFLPVCSPILLACNRFPGPGGVLT
jgi:hypothetical protein